jgi:hypothetical protein
METEGSLLNRGLQWDWGWGTIEWWPFRLEGDYLVADLSADRTPRSILALESERPLYLRLTDAVQPRPRGEAALRPGWRRMALEFANSYFPPVVSTLVSSGNRIPVARFGEEALLMWWAVHLRRQLDQPESATLNAALRAVVQIDELFPHVSPEDTTGWCITRWLAVFTSVYPGPLSAQIQPPEALMRALDVPPSARNPKALTVGQWKRLVELPEKRSRVVTAVVALSPHEADRRVEELRTAHADDEPRLWRVASAALASLVNLKLVGVFPTCYGPALDRGDARISIGFRVMSPLARIWYGLWESMGGVRLRACERARCGRLFVAGPPTQRFCSTRCNDAERQQVKRDTDLLKRQMARQSGADPPASAPARRRTPRA